MSDAPQQIWTAALRSGNYTQTVAELCSVFSDGHKEHCCLGVACEVAGMTYINSDQESRRGYDGHVTVLPLSVAAWLLADADTNGYGESARDPKIDIPDEYSDRNDGGYCLRCTSLNDEYHLTFEQIADLVDYFGLVAG